MGLKRRGCINNLLPRPVSPKTVFPESFAQGAILLFDRMDDKVAFVQEFVGRYRGEAKGANPGHDFIRVVIDGMKAVTNRFGANRQQEVFTSQTTDIARGNGEES